MYDPSRGDRHQEFYGGLRKPKELCHDAQVYRASLRAAERLHERGAAFGALSSTTS